MKKIVIILVIAVSFLLVVALSFLVLTQQETKSQKTSNNQKNSVTITQKQNIDKIEGGSENYRVWGFSLDEIQKAGGAKKFFPKNQKEIQAYADANGIKYKSIKLLLFRFGMAVEAATDKQEIAAIRKETAAIEEEGKKEIADTKKEIADTKKEIADIKAASKKRIDSINEEMVNKLRNHH